MNGISRIGMVTTLGLVLTTSPVLAQRHRDGNPQPPQQAAATHSGDVLAFVCEPGGPASIRIRTQNGEEQTFFLGPFWYVERVGFEARIGDRVQIDTVTPAWCGQQFAVTEVRNLESNTTLTLRNDQGMPLWRRGHGRGPHGGRSAGAAWFDRN
jgi:hypothetical protein